MKEIKTCFWFNDQSEEATKHYLSLFPQAKIVRTVPYGRAAEAIEFYTSRFPGAKVEQIARDEKTQAVLHARFTLAGQSFVIMEGPLEPEFEFTPGTSFVAFCDSQAEIDQIWQDLSAEPEAEQCGWLKDKFGVSWQILHRDWGKMMSDPDPARRERVMAVAMQMKKTDFKKIQDAYG